MKYLKRFNEELKSYTYYRTSQKLKRAGHIKRSERLKEYSKKVRLDEEKVEWKKNVAEYGKYGTYKFSFTKKEFTTVDDYYIMLIPGIDNTVDSYDKNSDNNRIVFEIRLIPTTSEVADKMNNYISDDGSWGLCPGFWAEIHFTESDDVDLKFTDFNLETYDFTIGVYKPYDRRCVNGIKKIFVDIFSKKIPFYDSCYNGMKNMSDKVEDMMRNDLNVPEYRNLELSNFMKTINVNKYYSE